MMIEPEGDAPKVRWRPRPWESEVEWYLRILTRYVVGVGGLVWETVADDLRNSIALLTFGAIATSTDVIGHVRDLIRDAHDQKIRQRVDEEE